MVYAKRLTQVPTSPLHYLVALSIVAALAFALGATAGLVGRRSAQTAPAAGMTSQEAGVAPATKGQAAAAAPRTHPATTVRVPYEAGWELYDGGWAGGPAFKVPAL